MQIDFSKLTTEQLRSMLTAGDEVLEALRVLGKAGASTVSRVIEHHGTFYEMDHYPPGDVYDNESASQYYYHSHRPDGGEHGHFHTFIRADAIPDTIKPLEIETQEERPEGEDAICHLVAVSMNPEGLPLQLFTTNQWVTGETFYSAPDAITLLKKFDVDHVYPCLGTNRWLSNMLRLFRPQIEQLLLERDKVIMDYIKQNPGKDVFEDEELEITSIINIDIDEQIENLDQELLKR